ncbi:MAG TPA: AI-2E family transporter [Acidimicrobiales bacterium]|nr:AI-2E family transporter [Acidimicrobiales bacterium]
MPNEQLKSRSLESVIIAIALKVLAISFAFGVVVLLAWRLRLILLLVLISFFIAALLNPALNLLTKLGMRRTLAVMTVYLVLLIFMFGVGYTFFNTVITQATHFAHTLPSLVREAQNGRGTVGHLIARFHLATYFASHSSALSSYVARLGKPALAVGKTVLSGFTSLITVLFLSFFILLEAPRVVTGFLRLFREDHASDVRRVIYLMTKQVTGFMLGNFATSVIAGVVSYVALLATGVPFASVLAIWTALVDFLPLVGGLLAGVPVVGVAFLHSVPAGIVVLVVFLIYQQIENHILNPLIISRTLRLNPLWVLLSVILGAETGAIIGSTFGAICGAIFALPAAGAVQVMIREFSARGYLIRKGLRTSPDA